MIERSSRTNPFHSTPRWTTVAAAATIRYDRLALMGHRVEPAGAGPAVHGNQPPGIGGKEGPELARRRRLRAGEEDVGDALALEVRPLVGRRGLDHSRPAVAIYIEGDRRAPGVQPHQRLV